MANSNKTKETQDKESLLNELETTNISQILVVIIIFALILNIYYLEFQKVQIDDELNGTNNSDYYTNFKYFPLIANRIITLVTFYFLYNNYYNYYNIDSSDIDNKINAWQNFIATFLVLYATILSGSNIEL